MWNKTAGAIAGLMLSGAAAAEIAVTIVPSNGGSYQITDAGNGKKTVTFNRSQGITDAVTVNIRGDDDDEIHFVIVNNSIHVTLLSIRGPGATDRIGLSGFNHRGWRPRDCRPSGTTPERGPGR
jgi:hypothetical protein